MVQPSSASLSNWDSGLSRLPVRSRGAFASMASRMAVSAIAAGVTMTEVRVTGSSGGTSTSTGRLPLPEPDVRLMTPTAPPKETTTTSAPMAILPQGRRMADQPPLNRREVI